MEAGDFFFLNIIRSIRHSFFLQKWYNKIIIKLGRNICRKRGSNDCKKTAYGLELLEYIRGAHQ